MMIFLGCLISCVVSSGLSLTVGCINSTYPSSSCCEGEIELDPTLTSIASSAFYGCSALKGSLTIPDSVEWIGSYAFENCADMTGSLTIGGSVTTIETNAFKNCSFTGILTIPDGVTSIGSSAFQYCEGFTGTLTIPDSLTAIEHSVFYKCYGFTGLTIGNSVTSIESSAFFKCKGFTGTLTIPDSVTTIEENAFYYCYGFTGLTIGDGVTSIEESAFYLCTGFTGSLTIPDKMSSIRDHAFSGCASFTGSVTFPSSVTLIDNYAFYSCSGFSYIGVYEATQVGSFAFQGCVDVDYLASSPTASPTGNSFFDFTIVRVVFSVGSFMLSIFGGWVLREKIAFYILNNWGHEYKFIYKGCRDVHIMEGSMIGLCVIDDKLMCAIGSKAHVLLIGDDNNGISQPLYELIFEELTLCSDSTGFILLPREKNQIRDFLISHKILHTSTVCGCFESYTELGNVTGWIYKIVLRSFELDHKRAANKVVRFSNIIVDNPLKESGTELTGLS